jgi:hypothetical protein
MLRHVSWYARRLRAMSSREVGERAMRFLHHRVDAAAFHVAPASWRSRWYPDGELLLRAEPLQSTIGFLEPDRAAGLQALFPEEAALLSDAASRVLEGRYRFFGYPEVTLDSDRGRDVDPFTGRGGAHPHPNPVD